MNTLPISYVVEGYSVMMFKVRTTLRALASKQIQLIILRAYLNRLQYSGQVEDKRYRTT
jgi:hypothetical protein